MQQDVADYNKAIVTIDEAGSNLRELEDEVEQHRVALQNAMKQRDGPSSRSADERRQTLRYDPHRRSRGSAVEALRHEHGTHDPRRPDRRPRLGVAGAFGLEFLYQSYHLAATSSASSSCRSWGSSRHPRRLSDPLVGPPLFTLFLAWLFTATCEIWPSSAIHPRRDLQPCANLFAGRTAILRYHSVSTVADGTHLCLDPGLQQPRPSTSIASARTSRATTGVISLDDVVDLPSRGSTLPARRSLSPSTTATSTISRRPSRSSRGTD